MQVEKARFVQIDEHFDASFHEVSAANVDTALMLSIRLPLSQGAAQVEDT